MPHSCPQLIYCNPVVGAMQTVYKTCSHCGSPGAMRKCAGCKIALYCGAGCQESHWNKHKHVCRAASNPSSKREEHSNKCDGSEDASACVCGGRSYCCERQRLSDWPQHVLVCAGACVPRSEVQQVLRHLRSYQVKWEAWIARCGGRGPPTGPGPLYPQPGDNAVEVELSRAAHGVSQRVLMALALNARDGSGSEEERKATWSVVRELAEACGTMTSLDNLVSGQLTAAIDCLNNVDTVPLDRPHMQMCGRLGRQVADLCERVSQAHIAAQARAKDLGAMHIARRETVAPAIHRTCVVCKQMNPRRRVKKCNRCGAILYCSKECQRRDWDKHKTGCGLKAAQTE